MRRKLALAAALLAVVSYLAVPVSSAWAHPGVSEPELCSACHSGAGVNPVATLVSNDGTTALYNVSNGGLEWAVFSGTTRLAGLPGSVGQFAVPVGQTYTLFAVNGFPGPLGVRSVTPTAPMAMFTMMVSSGPNGSVSPGSMMMASGSMQTFTFTPDPGFHVADVLVDGVSVGAMPSYTFIGVAADHSLAVSFAMDALTSFTVTSTAGPNGNITPVGAQLVVSGADIAFVIAADSGYHIADVLVDSVSVGAVGSWTFDNVAGDHTISASFAQDVAGTFAITPVAGANGTITPAEVQMVAGDGSSQFTISPDPGYHIETVSIDGVVIPTVSTYTFTNVHADHTIMATFSNDVDVPMVSRCSLSSSALSIRRNRSIKLSSTLSNSSPAAFFGQPVRYEVKRPGSSRYVLLATRVVSLTGKSSVTVRLTRRGYYRFRVRFLGTDEFLPSMSRTVTVRCR